MQLAFQGHELVLDPCGALYWPAQELLVVADLHLEKGSAFARRGAFLPPYDTEATLARLELAIARWRPATVLSLGDGFHDRRGPRDLSPGLMDRLAALVASVRWIWITGNHDPVVPLALGGACAPELVLDGITFTHIPNQIPGEVAGHLHPKARVEGSRLRSCRPCFAADAKRLLMPAFGSFTGGRNVLAPDFRRLFPRGFGAYLLGTERVFRVPHDRLVPEADCSRYVLDGWA